ncbi:1127_t:CDS:2 [Racocetra persica]|uniref:1127_t:CDS:1 n=1 Tax=Racocetra persica TaxID=160502 RepID=A0ACA9L0X3_9GLOM|nr:1127_t:CDS:2 [Racocetra persica]
MFYDTCFTNYILLSTDKVKVICSSDLSFLQQHNTIIVIITATPSKKKSRSYEKLDNQLDTARKSNNIPTTINNVISQVRHNEYSLKPNNTNPIPVNIKHDDLPDTDDNAILTPSPNTKKEVDVPSVDDNDPIMTIFTDLSLSLDKNTKQTRKI